MFTANQLFSFIYGGETFIENIKNKHPQTSNLYLTVKFGLEHSQDPGSAWELGRNVFEANICTSRTFKDTLSEEKIRT